MRICCYIPNVLFRPHHYCRINSAGCRRHRHGTAERAGSDPHCRVGFSRENLQQQASHTLHFGRIIEEGKRQKVKGKNQEDEFVDAINIDEEIGEIIDEVVVGLFRAPHSYTGEDVVEISCHGAPYILQQVMDVCIKAGAVPAKAGEFTQRAFLHGKLDLTQAEAVGDLIAAESRAAQQSAMHQLRGGFSDELKVMREELITFSALIELELDFRRKMSSLPIAQSFMIC